jgi:hypothetical protein
MLGATLRHTFRRHFRQKSISQPPTNFQMGSLRLAWPKRMRSARAAALSSVAASARIECSDQLVSSGDGPDMSTLPRSSKVRAMQFENQPDSYSSSRCRTAVPGCEDPIHIERVRHGCRRRTADFNLNREAVSRTDIGATAFMIASRCISALPGRY